jgi:hypothetical protein
MNELMPPLFPNIRESAIREILRKLSNSHPVVRRVLDLPFEVTECPPETCPLPHPRPLLFFAGHMHNGGSLILHFDPVFLSWARYTDTPDVREIVADAWAQAIKPWYASAEKRRFWRELILSEMKRA